MNMNQSASIEGILHRKLNMKTFSNNQVNVALSQIKILSMISNLRRLFDSATTIHQIQVMQKKSIFQMIFFTKNEKRQLIAIVPHFGSQLLAPQPVK